MNRFQLGIVLETTGLPVRQALAAASRLGVAGVQVDAVGDLAPDRLTATGRRDLRNLLRSYNLELTAVHCPLRRGVDAAEHQHQRIEHVRKAMQLAFDLGPRVVVAPLPRVPAEPDSPRAVTLRETLADLGAYGDRIGVRLALEGGLDAGDKVRDYLATFDTGGLAVNFDPANFLFNGHDPLASLTALAGSVIHTHARDGRAATLSGGPKEVPVGAGDIEWMVYVATLEAIEYRGFLVVDRESGENRFADVAAGVKFLRRFVPAASGPC
jgi:sugar phosphate isomerase/epimerase